MGELSIWHWLIVLIVVMLLFGTGKVSTLMGDVAKGIKSFKKNMAEDEPRAAEPPTAPAQPPASIAADVPTMSRTEAERTPVHHEG